MNFRRGREREDIEINLIPLIDILIVILIFLFLTTTYSRYAQLQINLPEASAAKAAEGPEILNVAVDAQGRYAINGSPTPFGNPQNFSQRLREAAGARKDPVIAISADAAATHQAVVNIMESARIAGYNHISFTTQTRQ
ncbi:ExbD/TolR family protein [Usitatibacter palustris]|uniref:Tol-Pal system protein TolR n=1 Tax=Usitatibacter palustris TaxID=2732487 RepID=A0A6M4H8R2_9PROT|nr:biopolymer transporter ExbD [Usitatibacter palustris]QJR15980.1 Tol-Pal system protein TolR [Usitatibacter palustris]